MEEININKKEVKEEEIPLAKKVDILWNEDMNVLKRKELKIPRKARVRKRKAKKGWIGVMRIDENNNATFEKVQLKDSSYKTRDGIFHSTDGREILNWQGKFPFVVQEAKRNNPKNFKFNEKENETYGQEYIMAKMLKEAIKGNKGSVSIIVWILAIGAGIFLINKLIGGGI